LDPPCDLAGARRLNEHVLDVMSRVLGEEHVDTLTAMGNLAITLLEIGEYVTALPLLLRCLAGKRKVLGDHHPDTIATANVLAHAAAEVQKQRSRRRDPGMGESENRIRHRHWKDILASYPI
jgi:hypothetical protein